MTLFDIELNGAAAQRPRARGQDRLGLHARPHDGTPLVGIDERPVPQEPRQGTAATQPYPRGDAFIPQQIDIAPEGTTLVNGGKIFTPFWTTPVLMKPGPPGGVNWPPSSYDAHERLSVRLRRRSHLVVSIAGGHGRAARRRRGLHRRRHRRLPHDVARRVRGRRRAHERARLAAALVRARATAARSRRRAGSCSSAAATAASRRSTRATGMKLWEFQTGAGMNSPATVVRAQRQAVRRRLLRRQPVRGLRARRQPLAVRLGRRARAGAAGRAR